MLGKRDIGFPSPGLLVVAVAVVVPVIVLILRRKWRQSVARSEEVKRLLVSASEESTRVEFEAREAYYYTATVTPSARVSVWTPTPNYTSAPFGSPLKSQRQCAVCFCPTTTLCAKCKAVRYWRTWGKSGDHATWEKLVFSTTSKLNVGAIQAFLTGSTANGSDLVLLLGRGLLQACWAWAVVSWIVSIPSP